MPSGDPYVFRAAGRFLRETANNVPRAAEASIARRVPRFVLAPADARHALSNLNTDNAVTLRQFGPGSGFSGVYNHENGTFLAYPSGDTWLRSGAMPENRVARLGGHRVVNRVLARTTGVAPTANVGFVAVMKEDGSFGFRWTSRSVNRYNPSFEGYKVPDHLRGPIMDAFTRSTGRAARSDV